MNLLERCWQWNGAERVSEKIYYEIDSIVQEHARRFLL